MFYERNITLSIDSKIDNIVLLSKAVRAICSTVVEDEIMLYNLELSLVEAASNVINHGYHRKAGNIVEVDVMISDSDLTIQIMDSGEKPFPPPPKKELTYNSDDITSLPESGIGLYLIYTIMDEVSFTERDGKNVFTMKKILHQGPKFS